MATQPCRACGRDIEMVQTKSGAWVPVVLERLAGIQIQASKASKDAAKQRGARVVTGYTDAGENVTIRIGGSPEGLLNEDDLPRVQVRESHFADCPARESFRRRP